MTRLQTYNGKLLYIDGKLITSEECCCDNDECPQCPPLSAMPKFCQIKITTPLGDYHLTFQGPVIPSWRKLDPVEDSIPEGECWYELEVSFEGGECIGYCEDIEPEVPLASPIICTLDSGCCCETPPEGEECDPEQIAPATETWKLDGVIKYAMRELISSGRGILVYRVNCQTGEKYRKLWWEYIHSQALSGRFIGSKQHKIQANGPPCNNYVCVDTTALYNQSTGHECDECPQFNWMASEDVPAEHLWECDLWNKIWLSNVGMQYSSVVGVKYLEENWVEIEDFFEPEDMTPRFGCAPCFPFPGASIVRCDQVTKDPGVITSYGDCLLFDFDPPDDFSYWMCDPQYPTGATEPFLADAPYPPEGVTIRHEPSPCPEILDGDDYAWPYGDEYISHHVAWDTSAVCDPSQPNAAEPCTSL